MKQSDETTSYAQMGMAALLPGMVHMLELMQAEVDNMRTQLAALQGKAAEPTKRGRKYQATERGGWPDDPEERRLEMARRMRTAAKNRKGSNLSELRKKNWAALSPAKRKKRLAAMLAGKKKHTVMQLEAAS